MQNQGTTPRLLLILLALAWLQPACGDRESETSKVPGLRSDAALEISNATVGTKPMSFADASKASGIDFRHDAGMSGRRFAPEQLGSGGALFDADGDGDLDLLCLNGGPLPGSAAPKLNVLFLNQGDGIFRRSDDLGDLEAGGDYGVGCAAADVDNDGDIDVFVSNFGLNHLFLNDGKGRFKRVQHSGLECDSWGASAAFGDLDGDGLVDLYLSNYLQFKLADHVDCYRGTTPIYCGPQRWEGAQDRVYRNLGGGVFRDMSDLAFANAPAGKGLGVALSDFDLDGDLDIYVANDQTPNFLFRNDGNFNFEAIGDIAGVQVSRDGESEAGMGIAFEDYDNDLLPDIAVTNFEDQVNALYHNEGDELFEEVAWDVGLGYATRKDLGWGITMADFDLDGRKDLFVVNGHVYDNASKIREGSQWKQRNRLFCGLVSGQFKEFSGSKTGPLSRQQASRGLVCGDLDRDGDVDVIVLNVADVPQVLINRVEGRSLRVQVKSKEGAFCPGVRVQITTKFGSQVATSAAGSSFLTCSHGDLVFGLGSTKIVGEITVTWPGGHRRRFRDLGSARVIRVGPVGPLEILSEDGSLRLGTRDSQ
ncbi:MAG: CRTAC1 family protein [Planctomycetota bacterium]